jgi:hypothetical protein
MTLLCRLNIHAINTSGRYTLTCRRCGKECT